MPAPLLLRSLFSPRRLPSIILAGLLVITLAGCDTSGSSEEENNTSNTPPTFTVTVEDKTEEHPRFGEGSEAGFVIDGEQGKELTLTRGTLYRFEMDNTPSTHPFYLSMSEVGAGAGEYTNGVSGNFASGNETLTFTPNADTPDTIYYQCANHSYMGWRINVTGTGNGDDGDDNGNDDPGGGYDY